MLFWRSPVCGPVMLFAAALVAAVPAGAQTTGNQGSGPAFALDIEAALARVGAKNTDARDRAGLRAFYAARSGAPVWVSAKGALSKASQLAGEIRKADDWGLDAKAFDVPALAPAQTAGGEAGVDGLADDEVRLSLAVLKYARHARGGRVEPTAITRFIDRTSQAYDAESVLTQIALARDPAGYLRDFNPQHPEFERLRQRLLALRASGEISQRTGAAEATRLLVNMEQWRWMPDDLGRFHVVVNVPEQLVRVVRDGRVIHTERVVVGKVNTQTPIFSDEMEQVIFHPFWGVPDSIKVNEVLPSLLGSGSLVARSNLRIQAGGRDIDPRTVDWTRTDIRKYHVYQPPGGGNVLGVVKFRFPNKHDVYMHDTPSKGLFKSAVRAFSHGCMRVQDPVRLAELVLAEDRGMSTEGVKAMTLVDAPQNNQINLSRKIPVHITYFTETIDTAGQVSTFKDLYGHEERVRLALEGKMHLIKPVPEPAGPASAESLARMAAANGRIEDFQPVAYKPSDWSRRAFSADGGFGTNGGN